MGANITIYCLENLTDYLQFERLCHDLMSLEGYSLIEPLGGFSDKGRDAIHISTSNETTIFAYSVREDWRAKLAEDASKIQKHNHRCDRLVFMSTARFSSGERDEAVNFIQNEFGWGLELFGVERLRILLESQYPHVKAQHPHIFPPEFLSLQSRLDASKDRDHLFISAGPEDRAIADWLTRKLTAEGYLVWYERFQLLGGETYPDDVNNAIKNRTFRFIALYSNASITNLEVMRQRNLALSIGEARENDFLIPINVDGVAINQLDRVTRALKFISFENNWATGLRQLLEKLESIACPQLLSHGKSVAARTFMEKDVLIDKEDWLFSNCLQIESFPGTILLFKMEKEIPYERLQELRFEWAYRKAGNLFLSFHPPSQPILDEFSGAQIGKLPWSKMEKVEGIDSENLVSELLRKSLIVRCHQKGLNYCPVSNLHYFPHGLVEGNRLRYRLPDGTRTFVNAAGRRKYWRPSGSEEYRYSLAPSFYVVRDLFDDFVILIQIRIRLSNTEGDALPSNKVNSRRKHLCKDWWNHDWLKRILAVSQFLGEDNNKIIIGSKDHIIVNAIPFNVKAPTSIDETALDRLSFARSELLLRQEENENVDEDESEIDD